MGIKSSCARYRIAERQIQLVKPKLLTERLGSQVLISETPLVEVLVECDFGYPFFVFVPPNLPILPPHHLPHSSSDAHSVDKAERSVLKSQLAIKQSVVLSMPS